MHRRPASSTPSGSRRAAPGTGLARALSKLGFCSRSQAWALIESGRVRVNGEPQRDPERRVRLDRDRIEVDGAKIRAQARLYFMLNKPRGLVTTLADEKGRDTVFRCFAGRALPFLSPVGRLDQASEGLLLFTNDTAWAARLTDPTTHLSKIYHVQVAARVDEALARQMEAGVVVAGEHLTTKRTRLLRRGERRTWLEIELDEGKNRQIRRLLGACGLEVVRLVRVAIGPLALGDLSKGQARALTPEEMRALAIAGRDRSPAEAR